MTIPAATGSSRLPTVSAILANKERRIADKKHGTHAMGKHQVRKIVSSALLISIFTACSDHQGASQTSRTSSGPAPSIATSKADQQATQTLSPEDRALVEKSAMKADCKEFARRVLASVQEATAASGSPAEWKNTDKQYQAQLRQSLERDESATPSRQYDEAACKKANDDWNWMIENEKDLAMQHIGSPNNMFDIGYKGRAMKIDYVAPDDVLQYGGAAAVSASDSASAIAATAITIAPVSVPQQSSSTTTGAPPDTPAEQPPQQIQTAAPATTPGAYPCSTSSECFRSLLSAASRENETAANTVAQAVGSLPRSPRGDRQQARAANDRGLAALKDGRYDIAQDNFSKAIAADAGDVEAMSNLAFTYTQLGNWDQAETLCETALALDPRRTSTWAPLAVALAKTGKPDQALQAMWLAYAFSSNREKTLEFISSKANTDGDATVKEMYRKSFLWLAQNQKPLFTEAD